MCYFPGVSLTIPEGAILKGNTEEIFIAVSREDKDRPKLTGMTPHYYTLHPSSKMHSPSNLGRKCNLFSFKM